MSYFYIETQLEYANDKIKFLENLIVDLYNKGETLPEFLSYEDWYKEREKNRQLRLKKEVFCQECAWSYSGDSCWYRCRHPSNLIVKETKDAVFNYKHIKKYIQKCKEKNYNNMCSDYKSWKETGTKIYEYYV